MEEWIEYHIKLGFDKFYLYDNSKVQYSGGTHSTKSFFVEGSVNKYGVDYNSLVNLTNNQVNILLKKIQKKYNCVTIINWSPRNAEGTIIHAQPEAHNHCLNLLKHDRIQWCASIDMDEYIVIKNCYNIKKFINKLLHNNKLEI